MVKMNFDERLSNSLILQKAIRDKTLYCNILHCLQYILAKIVTEIIQKLKQIFSFGKLQILESKYYGNKWFKSTWLRKLRKIILRLMLGYISRHLFPHFMGNM